VTGLLYIFVLAFVYSAPLLVIVWLSRRRITRHTAAVLVAISFVTASGFVLRRMDWFDVFRHGMPSLRWMLVTYGPLLAAYGVIGWLIGWAFTVRRSA
jgi:hypothetical protein